jgi:hypothetical protein
LIQTVERIVEVPKVIEKIVEVKVEVPTSNKLKLLNKNCLQIKIK